MKILSYTEARANFAKTLDAVVDDAEETVIHRSGHEPVVIIALAEYQSIKETAYLTSTPENAAFLRRSMAQLEAGEVTVKDPSEHPLMRESPDKAEVA